MLKIKTQKDKELRKPVHPNFAPKRFALCYEPPMIVIQYLVVNSGKLYHHKIRLASILSQNNVTEQDILKYIKQRHSLYFASGKVKDSQLLQLIAKLMLSHQQLNDANKENEQIQPPMSTRNHLIRQKKFQQSENISYTYSQDQKQGRSLKLVQIRQKEDKTNIRSVQAKKKQNIFCCKHQKQEENQESNIEWDLQLDQNFDFI